MNWGEQRSTSASTVGVSKIQAKIFTASALLKIHKLVSIHYSNDGEFYEEKKKWRKSPVKLVNCLIEVDIYKLQVRGFLSIVTCSVVLPGGKIKGINIESKKERKKEIKEWKIVSL